MMHILAFIIISVFKIIKWILIKSRLFIIVIPVAIVLMFYPDWYNANTLFAELIGFIMAILIMISWIVTLIKYLKIRKQNKERMIKWAYERYDR